MLLLTEVSSHLLLGVFFNERYIHILKFVHVLVYFLTEVVIKIIVLEEVWLHLLQIVLLDVWKHYTHKHIIQETTCLQMIEDLFVQILPFF